MGLLADLLFGGSDETECTEPDLDCGCEDCAERYRVAVHEAGHLVAFEVLDHPWDYAEIVEDETGETYSAGGMVKSAVDTDDLRGPDVHDFLVIGHAGHAAERAAFGQVAVSESDVMMLADLARRAYDPEASDKAQDQAERMIGEHVGMLEEFAEALFYEGVIYP